MLMLRSLLCGGGDRFSASDKSGFWDRGFRQALLPPSAGRAHEPTAPQKPRALFARTGLFGRVGPACGKKCFAKPYPEDPYLSLAGVLGGRGSAFGGASCEDPEFSEKVLKIAGTPRRLLQGHVIGDALVQCAQDVVVVNGGCERTHAKNLQTRRKYWPRSIYAHSLKDIGVMRDFMAEHVRRGGAIPTSSFTKSKAKQWNLRTRQMEGRRASSKKGIRSAYLLFYNRSKNQSAKSQSVLTNLQLRQKWDASPGLQAHYQSLLLREKFSKAYERPEHDKPFESLWEAGNADTPCSHGTCLNTVLRYGCGFELSQKGGGLSCARFGGGSRVPKGSL